MLCLLLWVVNSVVLLIKFVKFVLENLGVLCVINDGFILFVRGILCICILRICLWLCIFGRFIMIWWLKCFGCSNVGFNMLGWLVVVMIIMFLLFLKLFILISIWFSVCLCLLWLLLIFVLCWWFIVLILLMKIIYGEVFFVCLNMLCIWDVLILINILMKFELEIVKNGILVLLVIVLVSKVLFVLGGLIMSIFVGILLFSFWKWFGLCR